MDENVVDTDIQDEPSNDIENLDLLAPEGEVRYLEEDKPQAVADDTDEDEAPVENQEDVNKQPTDQAEPREDPKDPTEGMTDKERNNYFAQQRQARKESDYVSTLRQKAQKYVDQKSESDPEQYEDMDEAQAKKFQEMDELKQKLERQDREREVETAIAQVERAREYTAMSFQQAQTSIPMFNPGDKANYNEMLHQEATVDWAAAYLETEVATDENDQPILDESGTPIREIVGVKPGAPSPFDYLSQKADKFKTLLSQASARGQQNAQRNRASSELPSSAPEKRSGNSFEALEERIGNLPLA